MSSDNRLFILISFVISLSVEAHSKCVPLSTTRLCRDPCPSSSACPESSCPQECVYCKTGYYGPSCTRTCKGKSHCLNNNCVLLRSGRALNCSEGCRTGWRGLSCNSNCKHPCVACDRYTGECVGRCRDGYFGSGCTERCEENCAQCDKESGICTGACVSGFYGENCSQTCPTNCTQCGKTSGECTKENVTRERVHFPGEKNDLFVLIVLCALIGVAVAAIIIISMLMYKRWTLPNWKSPTLCRQIISESCEPMISPDLDHSYTNTFERPQKAANLYHFGPKHLSITP